MLCGKGTQHSVHKAARLGGAILFGEFHCLVDRGCSGNCLHEHDFEATKAQDVTIHCDLTYGEVLPRAIAGVVAPALGLRSVREQAFAAAAATAGAGEPRGCTGSDSGEVFYDVGSGTGKIPLQVAYQCWGLGGAGVVESSGVPPSLSQGCVRRAVGVELQGPGRHDVAVWAYARLATVAQQDIVAQVRGGETRGDQGVAKSPTLCDPRSCVPLLPPTLSFATT